MTIATYILYIIIALLGVISLYLLDELMRLKRKAAEDAMLIKEQNARMMDLCWVRKRYKIIKLDEFATASINNILKQYQDDGGEYNGVKDGLITLIKREYTQK